MCSLFTQRFSKYEIAEDLKTLPLEITRMEVSREWIYPTDDAIVLGDRNGEVAIGSYFWSLLPKGTQDTGAFTRKFATFNARSEDIETKRLYSGPWKKSQRLVIPVSGFVEYRGPKGSKEKLEIFRPGEKYTFIAGLYDNTKPDGKGYQTFTMLTCGPNEFMKPIHNRMPVILTDWRAWLSKEMTPEEAKAMTVPFLGKLDFRVLPKG